jgi:hypothetical protein
VTGQPGGQFLVGQAIERLAALQHRAAADPGLAVWLRTQSIPATRTCWTR